MTIILSGGDKMSDSMDKFFEDVFKKFDKDIVDRVLLMIQNDRELMDKYLKQVANNSKETVNDALSKKIEEKYNLQFKGKNYQPKSTLATYYEEH